ncbi:MAG: monovalent cation/H(+) antiporter subunit G [Kiloniellales bacterium]|nr:monovalent cation/H(+) antiporter subunit G [Kiloniellales bacterium]
MIDLALDILGWALLVSGGLMAAIAGLGLLRMPDLFTRMHAAGIGDTLAAGLILVGLMTQSGWSLNLVKLLLIIFFILFTSCTSTHALAKAALHGQVRPLLKPKKDGAPSKT